MFYSLVINWNSIYSFQEPFTPILSYPSSILRPPFTTTLSVYAHKEVEKGFTPTKVRWGCFTPMVGVRTPLRPSCLSSLIPLHPSCSLPLAIYALPLCMKCFTPFLLPPLAIYAFWKGGGEDLCNLRPWRCSLPQSTVCLIWEDSRAL